MGKLGKRARKFSQKNLQSVDRKKRKFNAMRENSRRNKRRNSDDGVNPESNGNVVVVPQTEARNESGAVAGNFLDAFFGEDEGSSIEDVSDSDGYLSEDSDCPYISDSDDDLELEDGGQPTIVRKSKEMPLEIAKKKEKIDQLREKDPVFAKFLDSRNRGLRQLRYVDASSDEEGEAEGKDKGFNFVKGKSLTTYTIDVWCWMALEEANTLPSLLNAFRRACHFGDFSHSLEMEIPNKEVYSKILTSVLSEADAIFRKLLNISGNKVNISKLSTSPKWLTVRPFLKSYLRSSIFLLKQLTDNQILAFALSKLRASVVFFSAFPSLFRRLIKAVTHFWATGDEHLSSTSYSLLHDIAAKLSTEWLEVCLTLTYQTFISRCQFVDAGSFKQIEFLSDCLVELYSVDIHCSYQKVSSALQQMARVLQSGLKTKSEEELQRIHSWQYVNCVEVWVKFITKNIRDHNLRPLLYSVIQIVMGIAHLFLGRRYFPLRIKCIRMLNQLSNSSGVFIPIVSLLLDTLECGGSNNIELGLGRTIDFSTVLKVPKQVLKSSEFQEKCILSTIEQLSAHLAQWSCSISFPELMAIPLIFLKKFIEETTIDSHRRLVRRLIDQIEQNRDFVERKREEVSFSPKDQASVDSFLQFERSSGGPPFSRYASNIQQLSNSMKGGSTLSSRK